MKAAVITFPGSNCDYDLLNTLQCFEGIEVLHLWHQDTDIQSADVVLIPGGFSYGDYMRCGAIAKFSPIMQAIRHHAAKGGKIIGICNGFQILTECGLLPGALRLNASGKFICKNVFIRLNEDSNLHSNIVNPKISYKIPIAHAEGNFFIPESELKELQRNNQILFTYCSEDGIVNDSHNPNGSMQNIAGICNRDRNVIGMMPHPERAANPLLFNTDGKLLLSALLHFQN
jgi:phosphoribosylformylglycinamidine synthase